MVRAVADPIAAGIVGGIVAGLESAAVRVGVGPVEGAVSGGLAEVAGAGHQIAVGKVAASDGGPRVLSLLRGPAGNLLAS